MRFIHHYAFAIHHGVELGQSLVQVPNPPSIKRCYAELKKSSIKESIFAGFLPYFGKVWVPMELCQLSLYGYANDGQFTWNLYKEFLPVYLNDRLYAVILRFRPAPKPRRGEIE